MERRSCKIGASLHTKKQQACTNRPCLSSLVAQNLMFQPAVLLLLFQALAIFCGHMFSQSLLDLDQCSFSQLTVFIPALLMVCSEQEICICINEQNNSLSHRSVASRLIEWQRETQGHAPFLRTLAMRSVRSDARKLAPAKTRIGRGWDFVSRISCSETHRTAARNTGALSVSARALTLCNVHVRRAARTRRCADARPG